MNNKTTKSSKLSSRKRVSNMTVAELEELSRHFNQEFVPSTPLTKADRRELARAARRGKGRPRIGEGAERVLVTIEGGLLRRADAYCRAKNLKRAELIAIGLQKAMSA